MRLFVTAAIGSEVYLEAAERLIFQVKRHNLFDHYVIVTESDFSQICPWLLDWYSPDELRATPGFGYFAWKAAIANAAFSGHWGDASCVVYLDAGCEVLLGPMAKRKLNALLIEAEDAGSLMFTTGCVEWKYSKKELMKYFPNLADPVLADQIQGGTWILAGQIGKALAEEWYRLVMLSPEITNNSQGLQAPGFVENRHDQSVLSLVHKSLGVPGNLRVTPSPRNTLVSQLKGLRFPIWVLRNRSAQSQVKLTVKLIASFLR